MFIYNIWIGRTHNKPRLPIVLASGLGGSLRTGHTIDYLNVGDENRKACCIYLSLLDRMGIKADHFGDSTTRLINL